MTQLDRRTLLRLLTGSALTAALPARAASRRQDLARLLQLAPAEQAWLHDLTASEQAELLAGLSAAGASRETTLRLALKLLSRRSHLFPYVGYLEVADKRSVCDGLVRE